MCVTLQRARLIDIGSRLYFQFLIPIGRRAHMCYESVCEQCEYRLVQPESCPGSVSAEYDPDVADLFKLLPASAQARIRGAVEQQERVAQGTICSAERQALAIAVMKNALFLRRQQLRKIRLDSRALWIAVVGLIFTIVIAAMVERRYCAAYAGGSVLFFLTASAIASVADTRRYERRHVLSAIARRMHALGATADDVELAVASARKAKSPVARFATVRAILADMERLEMQRNVRATAQAAAADDESW